MGNTLERVELEIRACNELIDSIQCSTNAALFGDEMDGIFEEAYDSDDETTAIFYRIRGFVIRRLQSRIHVLYSKLENG
ncbi:MAG: hypothetical protein WCY09_08475 [Candidatus Omnitrophota bacterium]